MVSDVSGVAERTRVRLLPLFGAVALGVAVAAVGWWATFVAAAILDDVSFGLGEPQYPLEPRLIVFGIAIGSCLTLLWSRVAAVTAAVLSLAGFASSLLFNASIAPELSGSVGLFLSGLGPQGVTPGLGLSSSEPLRAAVGDLGWAILNSGTHGSLTFLTGAWAAIAAWGILGIWRPVREGAALDWRSVRNLAGVLIGIVVVLVSWGLMPGIGRAITIMFGQGRDAFSVVPYLAVFAIALVTCGLVVRWTALGVGASLAALSLLAVSLLVADPPSNTVPRGFRGSWWSFSFDDLRIAILSSAFSSRLVLSAAWVSITGFQLLTGRRRRRADPGRSVDPEPDPPSAPAPIGG
jgi:hypothetical protein